MRKIDQEGFNLEDWSDYDGFDCADIPIDNDVSPCTKLSVHFAEGTPVGLMFGVNPNNAPSERQSMELTAVGAPDEGQYKFSLAGDGVGVISLQQSDNPWQCRIEALGPGRCTVKVEYSRDGESADAELKVIVYQEVRPSAIVDQFVYRASRTRDTIKALRVTSIKVRADGALFTAEKSNEVKQAAKAYRRLGAWPFRASITPADRNARVSPVQHVSGDNYATQFISTSKLVKPACQCSMFNWNATSQRKVIRKPTWWAPVAMIDLRALSDERVWIVDLSSEDLCAQAGFLANGQDQNVMNLCVSDRELLIAGDIPGTAVVGMLTLHQVAQGAELSPEEIMAFRERYGDTGAGPLLKGVLAAMNSQKYRTVVDHIGEVTALRQGNGPVYEANHRGLQCCWRETTARGSWRV